jgi:OmpA-OmpF porin, OOP family
MKAATAFAILACGALAASAANALPRGLAHVDPKAPCYRWPAVDMDHDGVFDRVDHCVNTPEGCKVDQYGCSIDSDHDGVCDGLDKCPNTPAGEKVDKDGCGPSDRRMGSASPNRHEQQLREQKQITLDNLHFETGSSRISSDSEADLREAGDALEKYPDLRIEVQGHTDKTGSEDTNKRLSQQRAETVRTYLLEHYRLKPQNVTAKGYSSKRTLTGERTEEEKQQDRRVVLKVLNPGALPGNVKVEQGH